MCSRSEGGGRGREEGIEREEREKKNNSNVERVNKFNNFFFNDTATTEIYTLSLHDALPI